MKTIVQFLSVGKNNPINPTKITNDTYILDESKSLNSQIVNSFELIEKHPQKNEIIGFNIVEVHSFQNREIIVHQNIFDFD
jgi:hypothetical protein